MAAAVEAQLDAVMNQAFAAHAIADPSFVEQIHRALFENARADRSSTCLRLCVSMTIGVDALDVEQMGKKEAGGSRPDDADLGANGFGE
jgi:hypothetical protein